MEKASLCPYLEQLNRRSAYTIKVIGSNVSNLSLQVVVEQYFKFFHKGVAAILHPIFLLMLFKFF